MNCDTPTAGVNVPAIYSIEYHQNNVNTVSICVINSKMKQVVLLIMIYGGV